MSGHDTAQTLVRIRTIMDDPRHLECRVGLRSPRNTEHKLTNELMHESLKDIQTFHYCKLSGGNYDNFSFKKLSLVPLLEVVHELYHHPRFVIPQYFISYVLSLGPNGEEAKKIFIRLERSYKTNFILKVNYEILLCRYIRLQ